MRLVRTAVLATATGALVLLGASGASAHPLGNFSINHSHNFTFEPTRIVDRAIVDFAEIPTAQAGDERSAEELAVRAQQECEALRQRVTLTVDGDVVGFVLTEFSLSHEPGQAGLPTSRLTCQLDAQVDLTTQRQVTFTDQYEPDRVGWREINATGDGVRLIDSPVPSTSTTGELRTYPGDLLASPLDVRELMVTTTPGAAPISPAPAATTEGRSPSLLQGGPFASAVERISATFDDLVGRRDLTLGVGLLAVALAMVLGASHALLPGHGKTVMAAYIAGRQGTTRDAVVVGATVTATHTGGVLLLGLALTASSSLTGESVLGWLGVVSGLIIAVLGAGLLRRARRHAPGMHGHRHTLGHHHHDHDHPHEHGHHHAHHHPRGRRRSHVHSHHDHQAPAKPVSVGPLLVVRDRRSLAMAAVVATPSSPQHAPRPLPSVESVAPKATEARPVSRRGLIGMGVAGGLVPSPSALIVLLSAIALGRTAFGVLLVIGYGLGMAATLTLAGLLLVRVRDRLKRRGGGGWSRTSAIARRWTAISPYLIALFVLAVGTGIAIRGLGAIS